MASSKVTLKLLVDTKNEKVLFAEASKPAIDFLFFHLLSLPVGTVVSFRNKGVVGSLGNLYMCPNRCTLNVTYDETTRCPLYCGKTMTSEVGYVRSNVTAGNVFMKNGIAAFMLMDNLAVEPMSTISTITFLNKFKIKEVGSLQEKVVEFGMTEGIELLKASLQTKMVLTGVFLKNNVDMCEEYHDRPFLNFKMPRFKSMAYFGLFVALGYIITSQVAKLDLSDNEQFQ
ncbi:hypothetical protein SESBI_29753 [Sesbania bispinosa]|nr:hypothetical protein SESBI_29753 [Sesbania bispinosa]